MALWYPRISSPHSNPSPGFSSLFRMLDEFDKYARDIGHVGSSNTNTSLQTLSPKFDVTEDDKEYTLQGELPGVNPENVNIEFTDPQTLVVRGRLEHKHEEGDPSLQKPEGTDTNDKPKDSGGGNPEKPRYWLRERSYGEFSRAFSFPASIDQDKVNAKFNSGILEITVPKAEKQGVKKITIQS